MNAAHIYTFQTTLLWLVKQIQNANLQALFIYLYILFSTSMNSNFLNIIHRQINKFLFQEHTAEVLLSLTMIACGISMFRYILRILRSSNNDSTIRNSEKSVEKGRQVSSLLDDVIKWKHFPRHLPFVRGIHRSTVNAPHKGQWRGALTFSLICVWRNDWVNNHEAGDLRPYLRRAMRRSGEKIISCLASTVWCNESHWLSFIPHSAFVQGWR